MTNYKKLKQKIQEAVPSLKEFINGCIIETPHWNMFKQKYEDNLFDVYIIYFGNVYDEDAGFVCNTVDIERHFDLSKCKYGKEPMLNDVLAWLDKTVGCWSCIVGQLTYIRELMVYWDLSKPYLKDQDQKLIDWLVGIGG